MSNVASKSEDKNYPLVYNENKKLFLKETEASVGHQIGDILMALHWSKFEGHETLHLTIEFNDLHNKLVQMDIPRSQLSGNPKLALDQLLNRGYECSRDKEDIRHILRYLDEARPEKTVHFTSRLGWHRKMFLSENNTIALDEKNILKYRPTTSTQPIDLGTSSTLEHWQEYALPLIECSSRMVFGVCQPLAAALRKPFTKIEGGGIHLHSPSGEETSSIGKTTAILASTSVFGKPDRLKLLNWQATMTGREELASQCTDFLICMDETANIEGNAKEVAKIISKTAFMFGSGQTKIRSKKFGPALTDTSVTTKAESADILYLSTGELSIAQIAKNGGFKRLQGEEVRLIDLPAVPSGGTIGIYEKLPNNWKKEGEASQLAAARLSEKVERSCSKYYGTALPVFIAHVENHFDEMQTRVKGLMQEFEKLAPPIKTGWDKRYIKRFALSYAAGMIAIDAKVLTWKKDVVKDAVLSCYCDARGCIPEPQRETSDAVQKLVKFLSSNILDVRKSKTTTLEQRKKTKGFRLKVTDRKSKIALKPSAFKHLFESNPSLCDAVLKQLCEDGLLMMEKNRPNHMTKQERIPGSDERLRYYVFKAKILKSKTSK